MPGVVATYPRAAQPAVRKKVERMQTDRPKSPTKFYTIEQIAQCVGASTRTVRRWIEKGLLVVHRINGLVWISDVDSQVFLATHRDG